MATLKYWLWLTTRKGISNSGILKLLEHFGTPEGIHFADPQEYDLVAGLTPLGKDSLLDKNMDTVNHILGECDRLGQRMMTIADANYPERLRNLYDPPVVLYLRGKDIRFDEEVVIGLIGSREPSLYGTKQALRLGQELALQGGVVISGLARGLDSEALRGALRGGGRVAAVVGGGLDVIYPRENRYLYEDVAAAGTLISEYPPGTGIKASNFPVRNRIISGLSLGVVVVEGSRTSGTRITARAALEQNRDVFAVPGPVDSPLSETPNSLIRCGEAKLITSAADILEEYQGIYPHKIHLRPGMAPIGYHISSMAPQEKIQPDAAPEEAAEQFPEEQPEVGQAEVGVDKPEKVTYIHWKDLTPMPTDDQRDILLTLEDKALTMEELIELAQVPARRAASAVTMLQLAGYVSEGPGKRFSATVRVKDD